MSTNYAIQNPGGTGDWGTVETALWQWVVNASGYSNSNVIWAEQQGHTPEGAFITLRMGESIKHGAVDEEQYATNGGSPPSDLTITEVGVREFSLEVQAFGNKGNETGSSSARATLSAVRAALELPGIRGALAAAGVSPFGPGPVRNVAVARGTIFEPRAVFECRFYVVETVSEMDTYISTVDSGYTSPGAQVAIPGTFSGP